MSVVYKYLSPDLKECYVGSTAYECKRKSNHKHMRGKCSSKLLFEKYGYDNCSYVVLEICSLEEQHTKEQWWLDHAVGAVNQKKAFRTEEQRLEEQRVYKSIYAPLYYENNKDKKKAYRKAFYEKHKK